VTRCERLRVLATSRQPLGLDEEKVLELRPLPHGGRDSDATQLFIERATRAGAALGDGTFDVDLVMDISSTLDGLPLAIELAAAMTRTLSLGDLRTHLDDRFDLLTEPRFLGGRERTLRDTVDWSYRRLEPLAQVLFRRVAVFAGTFTADAAADVCAFGDLDTRHVGTLLAALSERSLLERMETGGPSRYRMLETLRQFGVSVVDEEEAATVRARHADWAVRLAEQLGHDRLSVDEIQAAQRFGAELDNLRMALRWTYDARDEDRALRLVASLYVYALLEQRSELFDWAARMVERFSESRHPLFTEALGAAAVWRGMSGDQAGSGMITEQIALHEQRTGLPLGPVALGACAGVAARSGRYDEASEHLARLAQADPGGGMTLIVVGDVAVVESYTGRHDAAQARLAPVLPSAETSGVPSLMAFGATGWATVFGADDVDAAVGRLRRALSLARTVRARMLERIALSKLSTVSVRASDPAIAVDALLDALGGWQQDGAWRMEWATLYNAIELLGRLAMHEEAVVVHAASQQSPKAPALDGEQAQRIAGVVEEAERQMPREQLDAARAEGRTLSDNDAVAYARAALERSLSAVAQPSPAARGATRSP